MSDTDLHCFCHGKLAVRRRIQTGLNGGREFFGCSQYGSGSHCSYFSLVEKVPIPAGKRPLCNCSKPAVLKSANTETNFGREFYTCGTTKHCKFFKWFDVFMAIVVKEPASPSVAIAEFASGGLAQRDSISAPRCKCGNLAATKTASTARNNKREYYVCSSRSCDYFRWCADWQRQSKASSPKSVSDEQKTPANAPPNEYASQSEESIRKDIQRLQASLSDIALLATLNDRGERMRLKLEKLSDALSYKEKHPDPIRTKPVFAVNARLESSLQFLPADETKRIGLAEQGSNPSVRTKASLDLRLLEESLALKYNVKDVAVSEKLKSKLYPHQQLCFSWMYERERDGNQAGGPRGGVVADDMGLGKTIQMIALILTSLPSESDLPKTSSKDRIRCNSTLIICPLAVATQWSQEIQRHTHRNSLRVHIHHGKDQLKSVSEAGRFNVVITTYQTALSSFKQKAVLHDIHWFRIILDEAHVIKNHNTATAKAIFDLESQTRWMMTATPLQNHVQDMFSVFKFLRFAPFCDEDEWKMLFGSQNKKGVQKLRPILQGIMIRRTKEDKDEHGDPLIKLPPRHIEVYNLKFREEQQKAYDQISNDCRKAPFDERQLLVRVLRLRQACNCMIGPITSSSEPDICNNPESTTNSSSKPSPDDALETALNKLSIHSADDVKERDKRASNSSSSPDQKDDDDDDLTAALNLLSIHSKDEVKQEQGSLADCNSAQQQDGFSDCICASCLDFITDQPILDNSCHILCTECAATVSNSNGNCPVCGQKLPSGSNLTKHENPENGIQFNIVKNRESDLERFRNSPKMDFLIRHLVKIRRESPDEKAVVFSQWTTMLDLVGLCLDAAGIRSVRIDGSMNRGDRERSIDDFNNDSTVVVFLLSLKCAGVGLNLTAANHCFMLDTWWNYSIEDQAFCRIYRIGQTRPVHIYRMIIEGTIEEKVLEMQRRKQKLSDSLISSDGAARSIPKLSALDLRTLLLG